MLRRLFLIVLNMLLVWMGFTLIDRDMAVSVETAEISVMPKNAAIPFRQLTREEQAQIFFERLQIDEAHIRPKSIRESLKPWQSYISRYSLLYDVEPELIGAIVYAESKGDPFRISCDGALGLMQIMPSTADYLGFDNVIDPEENIRAGAKYIARLVSRYGETHALWAWNAGPSRVHKKFIPGETRKFIVEVLSVKTFLEGAKSADDVS